jgi:hypothetical protein
MLWFLPSFVSGGSLHENQNSGVLILDLCNAFRRPTQGPQQLSFSGVIKRTCVVYMETFSKNCFAWSEVLSNRTTNAIII